MNRQNAPYWLFVAALFTVILGVELIPEGMFFDGLGYAAIARNLASGIGTFWSPHYTDTLLGTFHDHPPLAFGLESLLFRLLGPSIYVERIYSGGMALLTALLMVALWRRLGEDERRGDGWLPLFFWTAIPLVTWSYGNNMLENTMGVFTTAAVYGVVCAMDGRGRRTWLVAAGVCVWLAVLSKGPVGLFPLGTPLVYWVVYRRGTPAEMVRSSLIVLAAAGAAAFVCLAPSGAARASLGEYVRIQFHSSQQFHSTLHHGAIVLRLVRELLPGLGVATVLLGIGAARRLGARTLAGNGRPALFCLLVGLSGSLPLAVTLKQSGFYLVPAFPFFALALGFVVAPTWSALSRDLRRGTRAHRVLSLLASLALIAALSIAALQFGRVRRDPQKLAAVRDILAIVPAKAHLGICPAMWTDWQLHAYFARYGQVSLDTNITRCTYAATSGDCDGELRKLPGWTPVSLHTDFLQLYSATQSAAGPSAPAPVTSE